MYHNLTLVSSLLPPFPLLLSFAFSFPSHAPAFPLPSSHPPLPSSSPPPHAFITADAQFEALTVKNKTKTGNKLPKGAHNDKTNLRKVDGFNLCTQSYEAYIGGTGIAGTGAFSYPVYPGDCNEV